MAEISSLREEGNRMYIEANSTEDLSDKAELYRQALLKYQAIIKLSPSADDLASIYKNLGMTTLRLAPIEFTDEMSTDRYNQSVGYFKQAKIKGSAVKDKAWLIGLQASYDKGVKDMVEHCEEMQLTDRIRTLSKYSKLLEKDNNYAYICSLIFAMQFKLSVLLMTDKKYLQSLNLLSQSNFYLAECQRYDILNRYTEEHKDYKERVFKYICICESSQAVAKGDEHLETLMKLGADNIQDIHQELINSCLGSYKEAVNLARENDLESEAIGLSRVGVIYLKFVKNKMKSAKYFMKCVDLAKAAHPKDFSSAKWFIEAYNELETIQNDENVFTEGVESTTSNHTKDEFLLNNADILSELSIKSQEGTDSLLSHIYAKHPPKGKEYSLPPITHMNRRTLLTLAAAHYSPDKQKYGDRDWKFLCEEISILINSKRDIQTY